MKFDYTKDKPTKYMVNVHRWNDSDQYYFNNYREAKEFYKNIIGKHHEAGTTINLYDVNKDIKKEWTNF